MGFYADHVFPRFMDWGMRQVDSLRSETLAGARGAVLEVGFGTGLNLRHYPKAVEKVVALDPLRALEQRVSERIAGARFPVERVSRLADDHLPFDDGSFDCVVTTWTLCSVEEPVAALSEMRRVLRDDGVYLFIEHGRSDDPTTARWQRRLNPLQRRIAGGCRLDRPIDELVASGGFEIRGLDRFVHDPGPRALSEMYRGHAVARPDRAG